MSAETRILAALARINGATDWHEMRAVGPVPTSGVFDRAYFDQGVQTGASSYRDYLSGGCRMEIMVPKARAIAASATLTPGQLVLDFGCAAGYLVQCLRWLDAEAFGLDVSKEAIATAPYPLSEWLFHREELDLVMFDDLVFDLAIAKDVLEHIPPDDLANVIRELRRISRKLFVSVPLAIWDGGPFIDSTDEGDPTHVNRYTAATWLKILGGESAIHPDACAALKGEHRIKSNLAVIIE